MGRRLSVSSSNNVECFLACVSGCFHDGLARCANQLIVGISVSNRAWTCRKKLCFSPAISTRKSINSAFLACATVLLIELPYRFSHQRSWYRTMDPASISISDVRIGRKHVDDAITAHADLRGGAPALCLAAPAGLGSIQRLRFTPRLMAWARHYSRALLLRPPVARRRNQSP